MLKNVIEKELKEQKISRALLLDGICEEQEFFLWVEEGEPAVWVMQVHAMAQRLGKSVDKYDVMLSAEHISSLSDESLLTICKIPWKNILESS